MKDAKLTLTPDALIITIPRTLFRARIDKTIYAALAQALSTEGLDEAAKYFTDEAALRRSPNVLEVLMEERRKALEDDSSG
jgi:hypothetical protein